MDDPFARPPSRAFEARYRGQCGNCGDYFEAGTLVKYDGDELIEDQCEPDSPRADRPRCPVCFQVHGAGWPPC